MKKIVLAFGICFYGLTIVNATPTISDAVDCDEFAADYVAVLEEYFGCMDSDSYNQSYTTVRNNCREMTGQ